jgi:hypothetical protein
VIIILVFAILLFGFISYLDHRKDMAKIKMGINPDAIPGDENDD